MTTPFQTEAILANGTELHYLERGHIQLDTAIHLIHLIHLKH
jgi:hypothetical protein